MNVTQSWWDKFWTEKSAATSANGPQAGAWADLVWQVGLEELETLFRQRAAGKKMLECGCGSARVSRYMAERGYACMLLDYSPQALAMAKAAFAAASLKGEFILGDMNRLPLADNLFDVVYSGGVLEFFDDVSVPLREIVRVLKPGGLFVAGIVPNKFSCQTLADLERTCAHSLKSFFTFRWQDIFLRLNHLPSGVSRASLKDYAAAFESSGLSGVTGYGTTPFPALSLGRFGERLYVRVLKRLLPQWRRFNRSHSSWSEKWGMAYVVYGVKSNNSVFEKPAAHE